ncbi:AfsR/SARP family transcriptional regulator [Streptomyces spectabilis]|uniref:AfsR family transcriptional regulator n=1 Tax=Streptomyces spectabilis TaxID=68270 RepID=A0A5P2XK49_STRST|nr:BTAD domain-containing putative transcriptional regulator [Streptomyces spectabilis]MBB5105446.1 DNA-binding SARP family transcriptional activator/tetratricopeptide (TPR) repeat protein [Streptomyces spectabilis]MCI3906635.1 tetratricopeptide repeat protein [Streptomyces spectabilis]QEV63455.1 AfsR family transcriptional regulator [Streptomyces spectabilis]GGV21669.1 regulatory protein AfsR [Streptomyces spectabilis]
MPPTASPARSSGDESGRTSAHRFTVLGPLRLYDGPAEVPVGAPQLRAVLAVLLLRARTPVSAWELIAAVWGDEAPPGALGSLRTHAFTLRRLLEPGRAPRAAARTLLTTGDGYSLNVDPEDVDLTVFELRTAEARRARAAGQLERARSLFVSALDLWRGTPLAGVPGPYAEAQRTRLEELRLSAVEARWEAEIASGGSDGAIGPLRALAAEHPWRERVHELLMTALHQAGRQADALDVHAHVRRALAEELGIRPGPGLDRLQQKILTEGPGGRTGDAAGPPAPGRSHGPAQLPQDVADFTGRGDEADRLCAALEKGGIVALSSISGMGGIGKTALAVHVARRMRHRFPDGQLYADLRGTDPRPAEPMEVLGRFLGVLGVRAGHLPRLPGERAALYRSLLATRQVFVVLDNARDPAQVRDLLPGAPGSAVVVTSRSRLVGLTGATLVDLRPMARAEALELLTRIVGEPSVSAEPEAAAEVLDACGHLPLAIRIVASRLVARPDHTLAETAALLADERRRLGALRAEDTAVETTFRLGMELLDAEQVRAFRLLALPEMPELGVPVAAALLARPEREAEELCESLVDLSLLESVAPGRYRYHDLLRLFARETARAEVPDHERTAALTRLLEFCLAAALGAHRASLPDDVFPGHVAALRHEGLDFAGPQQATVWLLDEQTSLLGLIEQAAGDASLSLTVCADLLLAADPLGRLGAQPYGIERAARTLAGAARAAGHRTAEARALYMLGSSVQHRFAMRLGAPALDRAVELCRETGDRRLLAHVLITRGGGALALRDFTAAHALLSEALTHCRALASRGIEAYALGFLGLALLATGRADEGLAHCREAVAVTRATGDVAGQANALHNLGQVCLRTGRTSEAFDCLHESLRLWRQTGSRFREGLLLGAIAQAHNLSGRPEEAAEHAARARDIAEARGDAGILARALAQLGHAHRAQGDTDRALEQYRRARSVFHELGLPDADDIARHLGEL